MRSNSQNAVNGQPAIKYVIKSFLTPVQKRIHTNRNIDNSIHTIISVPNLLVDARSKEEFFLCTKTFTYSSSSSSLDMLIGLVKINLTTNRYCYIQITSGFSLSGHVIKIFFHYLIILILF